MSSPQQAQSEQDPTEPSDTPSPTPTTTRTRHLPFSRWYPIVCGALTGVLVRVLVFAGGTGEGGLSAMLGSFIYFTPFVVGAVTIYLAENVKRRSYGYYISASAAASALFVVGTLCILVEGLVCVVVILPLFVILAVIGGLTMGIICRLTKRQHSTLSVFLALPLVLGPLEQNLTAPTETPYLEQTIHIAAPLSIVWQRINYIDHIPADKVATAWAYRIGVPKAQSAQTIEVPVSPEAPLGLVRKMRWEKAVHFDGTIVNWQPNQSVQWTYKYYPDSFPTNALDNHVVIGGKYFDLLDSSYLLKETAGGTDLTLRAHYRITTQFNFYARWLAQVLIGNFEETMLQYFKDEAEHASTVTTSSSAIGSPESAPPRRKM